MGLKSVYYLRLGSRKMCGGSFMYSNFLLRKNFKKNSMYC